MSDRQPHRRGVDKITWRPFLRMTGIVRGSPVFAFRLFVQQAHPADGAGKGGQHNAPKPHPQSSRLTVERVHSVSAPCEINGWEPSPSRLPVDPCVTASVVESLTSSPRSFCSGVLSDRLLGQSSRPPTLGGAVLCRSIC